MSRPAGPQSGGEGELPDTMLLDSIVLFVLFIIAVVAAERDSGGFFVVFVGFGYLAIRNYLERQKLAAAMREFVNRVRGLELNQMKLQGLAVPKPADAAATTSKPAPSQAQPTPQPYRPPTAPSPEHSKPIPVPVPVTPAQPTSPIQKPAAPPPAAP